MTADWSQFLDSADKNLSMIILLHQQKKKKKKRKKRNSLRGSILYFIKVSSSLHAEQRPITPNFIGNQFPLFEDDEGSLDEMIG